MKKSRFRGYITYGTKQAGAILLSIMKYAKDPLIHIHR